LDLRGGGGVLGEVGWVGVERFAASERIAVA
jgi:hypothetical protein